MASEIECPHTCNNCRHAIDYWPMYMGRAVGLWATVGCDRDPPPSEKRYKLTHTCELWEEQEDA